MKAEAYRVKTRGFQGNLSIDGEEFPYEEFQVEVHRGMAAILSPYGRFAPEFDSPIALPIA
jgi:sphingosine kinase